MKKDIYLVFLKTIQSAEYTIKELYECFKDFCEDYVLPCSSIGMFRERIEPILIEQGHEIEYSSPVKIKCIHIKNFY